MRLLRQLVGALALMWTIGATHAGVLVKAEVARRFPAPMMVGDKLADIPAWPLFKQNATATELVGYVFESVDLAPIPGFSGVPVNLLVAIDPQGSFLDVAVLSHHEPVFLDGLGEAPLLAFVKQYQGLSLKQNVNIDSKAKRTRKPDAGHASAGRAYLDGVSKATASVRIINQSVLSAALKVARKKLGFGQGPRPGPDRPRAQRSVRAKNRRRIAGRRHDRPLAPEPARGRTTVHGQCRRRTRPCTRWRSRMSVFIDLYVALGVGAHHRPQSAHRGQLEQAAEPPGCGRPRPAGDVAAAVQYFER